MTTTPNKSQFLADPITGAVGERSGEFVSMIYPVEVQGETWPIHLFVQRNPDTVGVNASRQDIDVKLAALQNRSVALDFSLMLFDAEISTETKTQIASQLEVMFQDENTLRHVEDILYSAPLPKNCDTSFVRGCKNHTRLRKFADELLESQPRILAIYTAWHGMRSHPRLETKDFREVTGKLVSRSFFRILAKAKSQVKIDNLSWVLELDLKTVCDLELPEGGENESAYSVKRLKERSRYRAMLERKRRRRLIRAFEQKRQRIKKAYERNRIPKNRTKSSTEPNKASEPPLFYGEN